MRKEREGGGGGGYKERLDKSHTIYEVYKGLDTISDQQNNGGRGQKCGHRG